MDVAITTHFRATDSARGGEGGGGGRLLAGKHVDWPIIVFPLSPGRPFPALTPIGCIDPLFLLGRFSVRFAGFDCSARRSRLESTARMFCLSTIAPLARLLARLP